MEMAQRGVELHRLEPAPALSRDFPFFGDPAAGVALAPGIPRAGTAQGVSVFRRFRHSLHGALARRRLEVLAVEARGQLLPLIGRHAPLRHVVALGGDDAHDWSFLSVEKMNLINIMF